MKVFPPRQTSPSNNQFLQIFRLPLFFRCVAFMNTAIIFSYYAIIYWTPPFDTIETNGLFQLLDEIGRFSILCISIDAVKRKVGAIIAIIPQQ